MAVAVVDVNDQDMSLVKGDSDEILVTVTDPSTDPATAINLHEAVDGTPDRHSILRFAAKLKERDQDNDDALLFKDTQNGSSDIKFLAQAGLTLGQAELLIDVADTNESDDPVIERDGDALHDWDLEASRQDEERAGVSAVGTVTVVNGSLAVVGVGTKFLSAKEGDILNLTDGIGNNELLPAVITEIIDDLNITVARSIWVDATGVTFEVRRNRRKTAAAGDFFYYRERVSKT